MNLSILIPTHNRPVLFQRCLKSVIENTTEKIEIFVNNDSDDIEEIKDSRVKYFYKKFNTLTEIYKFLLSKATKKYVYFLEDDDYLRKDFFDNIKNYLEGLGEYDIISGNYWPTYTKDLIFSHKNGEYNNIKDFIEALNFENLQLSKFIFKREKMKKWLYEEEYNDNNIHNDLNLVLAVSSISEKFICLPNIFYYQTTDAKDNISFPQYNKNIVSNYDFLEKYETIRQRP